MKTDISIILDIRREKKNQTYPVKLRVYSRDSQRAKMYSAGLDMTKKQFESVWLTEKPRKIHKEDRNFLDEIRVKAVKAAEKTEPFSFELFERKLHRRKGDGKNMIFHLENQADELKELGRFSTAETLESGLKSIKAYLNKDKPKGKEAEITNIPFNKITPAFLQKYESYMLEKGKSKTTIGIYLRALRTVFNRAIKENDVSEDIYPFGKGKYQIPNGKAVKKALTKEQIKALLQSKPDTEEQQKAKDFWFLSFLCNGMNIKDIALLKNKDINGDIMHFERAKTEHTNSEQTIISVHLTDYSKSIVEKYRNKDKAPDKFVFSILDNRMNKETAQRKIKGFTRFVNQHIKKLAAANGLPEDISTYFARHTFSTLAIQAGANMEFIQEALGHQNLSTTKRYFNGFEDSTKKQITESLLNFD